MTREEYVIYRDGLIERFYWCFSNNEFKYLTKQKNHRYLFRCTHFKTGRYFWVFDRTKTLEDDIKEYLETNQREG